MKHFRIKAVGYSLIETIVSMLILSASLAAAVQVMSTSLFRIEENQNKIMAVYLAQECMELTRNVRDSAWRQNMPWHCPFLDDGEIVQNAPQKYLTIENGVLDTQNISQGALNDYSFCRENLGVKVSEDPNQEGLEIEKKGVVYTQHLVFDAFGVTEENKSIQGVQTLVNVLEHARATCRVEWNERSGPKEIVLRHILTDWKQ